MVVEAKAMSKVEAAGYVIRAARELAKALSLMGKTFADTTIDARALNEAIEQYDRVYATHKGKGKGR